MTIQATYRDGAFYPDQPINLPENTPVQVTVVPQRAKELSREEIIAMRPTSLRITPEEFDALIDKYSVSVGSLPIDFSRADIYSEHD
ncbi:MAG: antitoxin AF2212-like protein [Bythopirellula sp.]|nr:antitoxin AF2212-like protein [Bythopirellula sp.]